MFLDFKKEMIAYICPITFTFANLTYPLTPHMWLNWHDAESGSNLRSLGQFCS